jgi:hypothetical protein
MKYSTNFDANGKYTSSLESMYLPSSVQESRTENRSAIVLNLAIVFLLLALIAIPFDRLHW